MPQELGLNIPTKEQTLNLIGFAAKDETNKMKGGKRLIWQIVTLTLEPSET